MKQNTAKDIAAEIRQQIRSGRIAPGKPVPSAREIVRHHGVAIATASRVLALLRKEGLVRAQRGVGTIVKSGERGSELRTDAVVRAAIAIADEEGLAKTTMRQVAIELGVPTVTVQSHFATEDALHLAMADAVLGEMPLPRARDWRERIEATLRAQWAGYARHPWMIALISMTRPQLLPNGMEHTEAVLSSLATLGLSGEDTLRTGVTLLGYVRGMALGLDAERAAEQDTGMTSEEWMDAREDLFAPLVPRFPMLAKFTQLGHVDMSLEALFERGLALLLDGLSANEKARSRRPRASPPRARPRVASPR